jgi:phosphoglycolate phosphatase
MTKIKAVVFDLDGTLLNTLDDLAAAVNHALDAHGMPTRTVDEVRRFVGNGVAKLIERAVPAGTDAATQQAVFDTFRAYYVEHSLDTTAPYDGILPALARLKTAGIAMAVVSNKLEEATAALCQHFFGDLIAIAIGDVPDRPRKPAPDGTLAALARLGVTPDEAIFVGDADTDVLTAKNTGLPCLGVTWGFRDADILRAAGATHLIDTPVQLADYILNRRD